MSNNQSDHQVSMLPKATRNGWLYFYILVACLAISAVILGELYRDTTKPGEVIARERSKHAVAVAFTIVYSEVDPAKADTIIDRIIAQIGPDSAKTDLIIGSPTTDPWCASIGEYRRNLKKAMTTHKVIPIGKQSMIASMIAGLLTKNKHRATVFLVGDITGSDISSIAPRTEETAAGVEIRSKVIGPVSIINFMDTTKPANNAYVELFRKKGLVRN